jgi:hypothetical protein
MLNNNRTHAHFVIDMARKQNRSFPLLQETVLCSKFRKLVMPHFHLRSVTMFDVQWHKLCIQKYLFYKYFEAGHGSRGV